MTQVFMLPGNAGARNLGRALQLTQTRANLIGEYVLRRDGPTSLVNSANPNNPLAPIGAPTFASTYDTLSVANWFDTGIADSQELTLIVFARGQTDSSPNAEIYCGTYDVANEATSVSLVINGGDLQANAPDAAGALHSTTATAVASPTSAFRMLALRTTGSSNFTLKADEFCAGDHTISQSLATGQTREVAASPTFCFGSPRGASGSGFTGPIDVAGALIYAVALTDSQLASVYADAQAAFALLGITI
jgi:hypothetical protein